MAETPYVPQIPDEKTIHRQLLNSCDVAARAEAMGNHPFGATLVAPDQESVLLNQINVDSVNHAEATLARIAARNYSPDYLWRCTLYTTVEPCAMCTGTIYWANIGCVVYGATEASLLAATGSHEENPTLDLPCREVFRCGQKPVAVYGPFAPLEKHIMSVHERFWQQR